MEKTAEYLSKKLSEFFVVTNDPYRGATDFNEKHPLFAGLTEREKKDGKRMSPLIHRSITEEANKRFGLDSKGIGKSRLQIDLWDEHKKIVYEIVLGNGEEIWKDVLKAILVKAKKLVVFCRSYPDETIKGYLAIKNTVSNLEQFLNKRLEVQVFHIQPKEPKSSWRR